MVTLHSVTLFKEGDVSGFGGGKTMRLADIDLLDLVVLVRPSGSSDRIGTRSMATKYLGHERWD